MLTRPNRIENPTKHKCLACKKKIANLDDAARCKNCDQADHKKYANLCGYTVSGDVRKCCGPTYAKKTKYRRLISLPQ